MAQIKIHNGGYYAHKNVSSSWKSKGDEKYINVRKLLMLITSVWVEIQLNL